MMNIIIRKNNIITGYILGILSILFDTILVSGGRIGLQIEINPDDLKEYIKAEYVDIV